MTIESLLKQAVTAGASDLHLSSGLPPVIRVDGELKNVSDTALEHKVLENMLAGCMDEQSKKNFELHWDADFSLAIKDVGRFRVNVFSQLQGIAAVFRIIPLTIPSFASLQLPETLKKLVNLPHGLVLVTGATGSGKSTTLAAMIDEINQHQAKHILTIEDPVEFMFEGKKSLIQQRELGKSAESFSHALRAALREDPDVIMVGEMRDLETIRLALTAAETGHLVFATLHSSSAKDTIYRIIDVFPAEEKALVRSMLAESLQAVIAQTLLPKKDKGRIAAMEIMMCNAAIRNLIREDKIAQMASVIQTGSAEGMQTLEQHLKILRSSQLIL